MIRTIAGQLCRVEQVQGNPHAEHALALDLVESFLRHAAVVAIGVYRTAGAKSRDINRVIASQLPWPSMGSWKNFLAAFCKADPDLFPPGFQAGFLAPLTKPIKVQAVKDARWEGEAILSADAREAGDPAGRPDVSAMQLLDFAVTWRNDLAHGTHTRDDRHLAFAPALLAGAVAMVRAVERIWKAAPVFVAQEGERREGALVHRLVSLVPGVEDASAGVGEVEPGRLYVGIGAGRPGLAALYPVALWDGEEILFLNGTRDYQNIKYLGFGEGKRIKTDDHEEAFCAFVARFITGSTHTSFDLSDARALARAMDLKDVGWSFPRLRAGDRLGDRRGKCYQLVEQLGAGGMAVVWKARDCETQQTVAVKILLDPANAARFRREARALKAISEKTNRIVKYVDFQFDADPRRLVAFIVMEYLEGGTLEDRCDPGRPPDYDQLLQWMDDAMEGLEAVHDTGVVHRDLKPGNMMVDSDGRVKLTDLGLAGATRGALLTSDGLTEHGTAIGTYAFCPLEQLQAGVDAPVGPHSDIFSVGATFYYLVSGEHPFGKENQAVIAGNQIASRDRGAGMPVPLWKLRPDCPRSLADLVHSMIRVAPDLRPKAAGDVRAAISRVRQRIRETERNDDLSLGGMLADDLEFGALMPRWTSRMVFRWYPAFVAAATCIYLALGHHLGLWTETPLDQFGLDGRFVLKGPMGEDTVLIVGVPLSLVFVLLLHLARRRIVIPIRELFRLDGGSGRGAWKAAERRNERWSRWMGSRWALAVAAGVAFAGTAGATVQFLDLAETQGALYYFDYRISPVLFVVTRLNFFFSCFASMYILLALLAMGDVLTSILRGARPAPDFRSGDGANGLAPVGKVLSTFLPVLLGLGLMSVVGLEANARRGTAPGFWFSWCAMLGTTVGYYLLIGWTVSPIHRHVDRYRSGEVELVSNKRRSISEKVRALLDPAVDLGPDKAGNYFEYKRLCAELEDSERRLSRAWTWPISRAATALLLVLGSLPPAVAVAVSQVHGVP